MSWPIHHRTSPATGNSNALGPASPNTTTAAEGSQSADRSEAMRTGHPGQGNWSRNTPSDRPAAGGHPANRRQGGLGHAWSQDPVGAARFANGFGSLDRFYARYPEMRPIDLPAEDDVDGFAQVVDSVASAVGDPDHYRRLREEYSPAAILGGLRALHRSANGGGPDGPAIARDRVPVRTWTEESEEPKEKEIAPRRSGRDPSIFGFLTRQPLGMAHQTAFGKLMSDRIAFIAWFKQCDVAALAPVHEENKRLAASLSKISPIFEGELDRCDDFDEDYRRNFNKFSGGMHVLFCSLDVIEIEYSEIKFFTEANIAMSRKELLSKLKNCEDFIKHVKSSNSDIEMQFFIKKNIYSIRWKAWRAGSRKTIRSFLNYLTTDKKFEARPAFERILIKAMLELYRTADLKRCRAALQAAIQEEWPKLPDFRSCSMRKDSDDFRRFKECASANEKARAQEPPPSDGTADDGLESLLVGLTESLEELRNIDRLPYRDELESDDDSSDFDQDEERLRSIDDLLCQLKICGILDGRVCDRKFAADLQAFIDVIGLSNLT